MRTLFSTRMIQVALATGLVFTALGAVSCSRGPASGAGASDDHGVFVALDGSAAAGLRVRVITETGKEVYAASGIKDMRHIDPGVFMPKPGTGDGSDWGLKLTSGSGKIMIIDRSGKKTIDPPGVPSGDFVEGLTPVSQLRGGIFGGKCGYMDTNHQMKIPFDFDGCLPFSEGLAPIAKGGKYGYINTAGEVKIEPRFDRACLFTGGLARVLVYRTWSVIDAAGAVSFSNERTGCVVYSEGLMVAHSKNKLGYVDRTGTFVIPAKYEAGGNFVEGRAFVMFDQHRRTILIDKTGNQIPTAELTDAEDFEHGLARARQGNLWGLMDTQGKFVVAPKYDTIEPLASGLRVAIVQGESTTFLDERGAVVKPPAPYCLAYHHGVFLCVKDPGEGGLDFLNPLNHPMNVIEYIRLDGTRIGGIDLRGFVPPDQK